MIDPLLKSGARQAHEAKRLAAIDLARKYRHTR